VGKTIRGSRKPLLKGFLEEENLDRRLRSWAKAITWRALGILILGLIAWIYTGNLEQTSIITVAFNGVRLILYYVHEHLWERVKWGRD